MDQHMKAMDWLEVNLEERVYQLDTDQIKAMIEQVTCERNLK